MHVGIAGWWTVEQNRIGAVRQQKRIQWKVVVTHWKEPPSLQPCPQTVGEESPGKWCF